MIVKIVCIYVMAGAYDLLVLTPLLYIATRTTISENDSDDVTWAMASLLLPPVIVPFSVFTILLITVRTQHNGSPWQLYVRMVGKLRNL